MSKQRAESTGGRGEWLDKEQYEVCSAAQAMDGKWQLARLDPCRQCQSRPATTTGSLGPAGRLRPAGLSVLAGEITEVIERAYEVKKKRSGTGGDKSKLSYAASSRMGFIFCCMRQQLGLAQLTFC